MTTITVPASGGSLGLSRAFGRMYVRNRTQLFFSLVFPVVFLAMFAVVGALGAQPPAIEIVGAADASIPIADLTAAEVAVGFATDTELATESLRAGTAIAVFDTETQVALIVDDASVPEIRDAARRAGYTVVPFSSDEVFDFVRFGLPGVLAFMTLNVAFFGTTSTLVELRRDGSLNMLRRTPARALHIITAPLASKLIGYAVVYALLIAVAATLGYIDLASLPSALGIGLLAFVVAMTWAYLAGARGTNPAIATGIAGMALPVVLMAGGVLLPLEIMPEIVTRIAFVNPVAHVGSLLRHSITGVDPTWPIGTSLLVLLASAVIAIALSVRLFRWR